jgi:peptide deformylase
VESASGEKKVIRQLVELNRGEAFSKITSLRIASSEVTDFGDAFRRLVTDLRDTLYAHSIAIGLAAPQIGISQRVAVIDISEGKTEPAIVIANPRNVETSGKKDLKRESCMSLPHLGGDVERRHNIRFVCENEEGQTTTIEAHGFLARVYCHEIDHLDGVLYVDRMKSGAALEEVDFFPK